MKLVPSYVPRLPEPLMREDKGELHLLLHPDRPLWTVVNSSGLQIAQLCDGTRTVGEIAAHIAAHYAQDPARVQADVVAYLQGLERAGLLNGGATVGGSLTPPLRLHLNVTERCNLRCLHCAVTDESAPPDALDLAEMRHLVEQLSPANDDSIAFSGGEPLLRRETLDALRYASQRVRTTLATNATLIDEDIAAALSELDLSIQISLDGASAAIHDRIRGHGAFDRTLEAVRLLRKHGFSGELAFCMTIMRLNRNDVSNMVQLAHQMGVNLRLMPLQKQGRADTTWSELCLAPQEWIQFYRFVYQELVFSQSNLGISIDGGFQGFVIDVPAHDAWCGIGRYLAIDAQGNAYPCSMLMHPDFCLGNVKHETLRQITSSSRLQRLEQFCLARKIVIPQCRSCHWRNFCQACCPASILALKGTMLATDELCDFRRWLYRETFFDLAQRKLERGKLMTEGAC